MIVYAHLLFRSEAVLSRVYRLYDFHGTRHIRMCNFMVVVLNIGSFGSSQLCNSLKIFSFSYLKLKRAVEISHHASVIFDALGA